MDIIFIIIYIEKYACFLNDYKKTLTVQPIIKLSKAKTGENCSMERDRRSIKLFASKSNDNTRYILDSKSQEIRCGHSFKQVKVTNFNPNCWYRLYPSGKIRSAVCICGRFDGMSQLILRLLRQHGNSESFVEKNAI